MFMLYYLILASAKRWSNIPPGLLHGTRRRDGSTIIAEVWLHIAEPTRKHSGASGRHRPRLAGEGMRKETIHDAAVNKRANLTMGVARRAEGAGLPQLLIGPWR